MCRLTVYFIWKFLTKYWDIIARFKMIKIKARNTSKKMAFITPGSAENNDFKTRMPPPHINRISL